MRKLVAWAFMYSLDGLLADDGTEYWDFCFGLPGDPAELAQKLEASEKFQSTFRFGRYLGSGWFQGAAAVGVYAVGRFALERDAETHTNKVAHVGYDLLRANLITQGLTWGIKIAVRRDRPTGECCSFPSGHTSATFASAAVLQRRRRRPCSPP